MNRRVLWLLGPALVAGVAYLDPGNVASNITSGARYGYLLVWVVVLGNTMAWLVQYLSAKLGVVTGRSLPEVLGERIRSPWGRRAYWVQAEVVAMATDIAEIIGGAVALWLLFGIPLVWGGLITGVVSLALLSVRGARRFELLILGLIVIIVIGFTIGLWLAPPPIGSVLDGLVPRFAGTDSVLLATSILGATIMPHAIYAHAGLSRDRHRSGVTPSESEIATLLRAQRVDVTVAMAIAGTVNLALLLVAASALHGAENTDTLT
ncbi:MAG: Nramp family divalent metal transporter, partial [Agromyces sp.]